MRKRHVFVQEVQYDEKGNHQTVMEVPEGNVVTWKQLIVWKMIEGSWKCVALARI